MTKPKKLAAARPLPVASKASSMSTKAEGYDDETLADATSELKAFHHNDGRYSNFGFSRFWWEGSGTREGISFKVQKKLYPVRRTDEPATITAARADLLLPSDAQQDYADIPHLLERFDQTLPLSEKHAFAQITLRFPNAANIHSAFEEARAFAWDFLVVRRRLAALVIAHAPFLAGSGNDLHVHLIAPLRRLGAFGWGEMEHQLPHDRGRAATYEAWADFTAKWHEGTD